LLTIEQLAAATTLSVSTIRRLVRKGAVVGHQPGGPRHRIMFPPDAIERAAKSARPPGAEDTAGAPPPEPVARPPRGPRPKWFGPS
jgi:excisionase family DNA binding protein